MRLLGHHRAVLELRAIGSPLAADPPPMVFRSRGPVAPPVLAATIESLARRHEGLRVRLVGSDPEPVLQDQPVAAADVLTVRAGGRAGPMPVAREMAAGKPSGLGRPLWRVALVDGEAGDGHIVVSADRLIADSWSLHILADELCQLYEQHRTGRPARISDSPAQLGDLAEVESHIEHGEDGVWEREYWARQFTCRPPVRRPPRRSTAELARVIPVPLDPATWSGVAGLAQQASATMFMVVVAAVWRIMADDLRCDGRLLLTEVANRDDPALDCLIGHAANLRPIVPPAGAVPDLAVGVRLFRDRLLDTLTYAGLPVTSIGQGFWHSFTAGALAPVLVEFDTANEPEAIEAGALELLNDLKARSVRVARADLHVLLSVRAGVPELLLLHPPRAVDESRAERLAVRLRLVLGELAAASVPRRPPGGDFDRVLPRPEVGPCTPHTNCR